jgi:hypothetical protein
MEAIYSSETFFFRTTRRYNLDVSTCRSYQCETLKPNFVRSISHFIRRTSNIFHSWTWQFTRIRNRDLVFVISVFFYAVSCGILRLVKAQLNRHLAIYNIFNFQWQVIFTLQKVDSGINGSAVCIWGSLKFSYVNVSWLIGIPLSQVSTILLWFSTSPPSTSLSVSKDTFPSQINYAPI